MVKLASDDELGRKIQGAGLTTKKRSTEKRGKL